jgi:HEAT repeat protein
LTHALVHRDQQTDSKAASHIRFTAALSLAKIGTKAVEAIPALKDALYLDQNRYVNGNALLALERIQTSEALKIVLNYLKPSRWCTKTTASSLY